MRDRAIDDRMLHLRRGFDAIGRRGRSRLIAHFFALVCCGGLASGCSLSLPMAGLGSDELATGTIKPKAAASPLSAEMDNEDWRRAKSALDTALDPQGNGASVLWDNPASGAKGSFVPLAQPYPKDDKICRPFSAHIDVKGRSERFVQSSACRVNSGDWIIGRIESLPAPMSDSPKKRDNLADRSKSTQLK